MISWCIKHNAFSRCILFVFAYCTLCYVYNGSYNEVEPFVMGVVEMDDILLSVRGIKKIFGPTVALSNVDFELRRGEIHGLIGENGSGKSTLTSIIAGIHQADAGTMEFIGTSYHPLNVVDAQRKGIAMVVQEMGTVPELTVAENIYLGKEKLFTKFGLVNKREMENNAARALEKIGDTSIAASIPVSMLSFEDRKVVELAKATLDSPSIFILDETTTAISNYGRQLMYAVMEKLRLEGKGVIFITHDLEELVSVCTKVTVLRDGVIIGSLDKAEFSIDLIKTMMVGRDIKDNLYRADYNGSISDEIVMRAQSLCGAGLIENITLDLHRGEILGLGGLSDSGMHELGRLLFGLDKAISGTVVLADGTRVRKPETAVNSGLGYVSKNRDQEALMLRASIRDNIVLSSLNNILRGVFVTQKAEDSLTCRMVDSLGIKCASTDQQVRFLSGGNKQKVVFAKWVGTKSRILILDCPTRGVDVGVKCSMYDLIYQLKTDGYSIVIISEELQELIGMCDRVLIIKDGRIQGEYPRSRTLSERDLINSMI